MLMKNYKYNLKLWVSCLLIFLAVAPFVFFYYRAEDVIQYFHRRYNVLDATVACIFTLPLLLLIGFSPRVARFCARDLSRVSETATTARYLACLTSAILVLCVVTMMF